LGWVGVGCGVIDWLIGFVVGWCGDRCLGVMVRCLDGRITCMYVVTDQLTAKRD
jgi:hypothetical protein